MRNSYWRYIIMNGMKPKFLDNINLPQSNYTTPNPYQNPVPTKLNLRQLSQYAQAHGKKISELTNDEVEKFRV